MKRFILPLIFVFVAVAGPISAEETAVTAPAAPAGQPSSTIASDRNYASHLSYQVYFADYLELRKGKHPDLIFIGDSITEQWRWGPGWPVWKKHFEDRAIDFGLGSDKTQHALWRLQNVDLKAFGPKMACILIGTNNTGDSPEDIAAGVKAVIEATKATFRHVKIAVVSILPNARATEKMAAANALIQPLADGKTVFYLDLAAKFTPEGTNWKGLGRDKLHLTAEGYEMWAAELEKLLPQMRPAE